MDVAILGEEETIGRKITIQDLENRDLESEIQYLWGTPAPPMPWCDQKAAINHDQKALLVAESKVPIAALLLQFI